MPQPVLLPVLLVVASMLTLGCNTPDLPNIPAADSDIQGPAVTPSLLEKARDGRLLFPANGGTNHHHHHKGPDADNVDGGPAAADDGVGVDDGPQETHEGHGAP